MPMINWEEQNLDYVVADRAPVLLNQVKAHETICSISDLGNFRITVQQAESSSWIRAVYRLWRSTNLLTSLASQRVKGKMQGMHFFLFVL